MIRVRTSLILSFLIILGLSFSAQAAKIPSLWVEGKDRPSERVNNGIRSLSPDVFLRISEKFSDAVVNISTTTIVHGPKAMPFLPHRPRRGPQTPEKRGRSPFDDFFGGDFYDFFFGQPSPVPRREVPQRSLGSGFILNSDGYIVTNNHVVENADEIRVVLADESEHKAKVIGRDPKTDVALLKIEAETDLSTVILGDSEQLKVGEVVVAIGNPFGLSHSVTQGIVSAKERSIGFGPYEDFIQTDASINPGNSGGPLLNLQGEVIGINTAIVLTGQGIGFAIPINLAKSILLSLKEQGKVVRGWLGVAIQKVSEDHVKALRLPTRTGALIAEVVPNSPAEKGGLKAGDVIIRFDGKLVENNRSLPILVAETPVGKKIDVEVIRDADSKKLSVKIGELKEEAPMMAGAPPEGTDQLGLQVDTLSSEMARAMGMDPKTKAVVVIDVKPSSPAYVKGIRKNDVIVEVDRKPTPNRSAYRVEVAKLKMGDTVLLLIKRGSATTLYIAFTL